MVGTIATNRAAAEERIFATFGQAFERNMGALASVSMPEARKELGASRLALEHAVMKAAWDKLPEEKREDKFPIGCLYKSQAIDYDAAYDQVIERAGGAHK